MEFLKDNFFRVYRCVTSLTERMNIHSALAFAGIAGPVVLVVTDATAGIGAENYSFISGSISSLALTRIGFLLVIGFMAIGLLVEIFVAGLLYNIRHHRGFHLGIAMLVFLGFALLLVGAFRTDPVGAPDTVEGTIHGLAAFVVFWLFPIAILVLAPSIKRDTAWTSLHRYTIIAAILALILALLATFIKDHISWFGLLERLLVANLIIWVGTAAFRMLCISIKRS